MKRRNTISTRKTLTSNSRRRQLLKRVHQRTIARRQHYQGMELIEELAEAC